MPSSLSLLDLPEVALRRITNYLDFSAHQPLRKTCHDLRNFIDDTQPDSSLTSIDFRIELDAIHVFLRLKNEKNLQLQLRKTKNGCNFWWFQDHNKYTKVLENQDFVDVAFKNFENVLLNQKSKMDNFSMEYHFQCLENPEEAIKFSARLSEILQSRQQKLRASLLSCTVFNQYQVMDVIPYLDPKSLTDMVLGNIRARNELFELDLREILNLDHWNYVENLTTQNFLVNVPIANFLRLKRAYIGYETVTMDMVMAVKEIFLHSSHMEFFELRYEKNDAEADIIRLFGEPWKEPNGYRISPQEWFFRIPNGWN